MGAMCERVGRALYRPVRAASQQPLCGATWKDHEM